MNAYRCKFNNRGVTADIFAHIEAIKEAVRQFVTEQVRRIGGLFD
jgi:hypothetical protein